MKLSAGQAAEATGKSIPTITRAIKKGLISAEKTTAGGYLIDPSELFRVFQPLPQKTDSGLSADSAAAGNDLPFKLTGLESEIRLLREMLARADDSISDLRKDRDQWRDQANAATRLLENPRQTKTDGNRPSRWWPFSRSVA
jgi:hypothetical protein